MKMTTKKRTEQVYDIDFKNGIMSKVTPYDCGDGGYMFMAHVSFMTKQQEIVTQFEKELKVNLSDIKLTDEHSIENKKILQKFVDWIAKNYWGLEDE